MYIAIDAGGTNTRVAGANELTNPTLIGEPLQRRNSHDFENDLDFMVHAALRLAKGGKIDAVGIGTPGMPNETKTGIRSARNLPGWVGHELVGRLSEELDCPVFYDTDVAAAGLGQAYYGKEQGNFDYLIWGTGIGGGSVERELPQPAVSLIDWRAYLADWENDDSGAQLTKRFGKAPEDFTIEDWETVSREFKDHLARYVEVRRPRAVVFGGGLAVRHAQMIEDAGRELGVKVEVTEFGKNGGLVGALGLIRRAIDLSEKSE